MRNWQRWGLSILLGFGCGAAASFMDPTATFMEVMRHGVGGALPCMVALKMTINQDESGVEPPDKVFKAGA